MAVSLKPLREQVMVITGASSGIGLCTAKMAAAGGARVVLAARNGEALADIERQITAAGGQAAHVVADVGKRADVQRVTRATFRPQNETIVTLSHKADAPAAQGSQGGANHD